MMGQEKSLNDPIKAGGIDEWQDYQLIQFDQELIVSQLQEYDDKKNCLTMPKVLNDRERDNYSKKTYGKSQDFR